MLKEHSPKEMKQALIEVLKAGLVSFIAGPPGTAKSSIVKQIADEYDLVMLDTRLSTYAPEDLNGLPMRTGDKATFVPFDNFPIKGDPIPKGKNGFLIFLDEITSCAKSVEAAAYRLVLDREIGNHKLHPDTYIICAGNRETDGAVARRLGTAMRTRVVHLSMGISTDDFIEYANDKRLDSRIVGYLSFAPTDLYVYDKNSTDETYPCPRTWEFVSQYIKGKSVDDISTRILGGIISFGMAQKFMTYLEVYSQLPSYEQIVKFPEQTNVPEEMETRYAVATMLLDRCDIADFEQVTKYIHRLPTEYQMVFLLGIRRRQPKIVNQTKIWAKAIQSIHGYLTDDSDSIAA